MPAHQLLISELAAELVLIAGVHACICASADGYSLRMPKDHPPIPVGISSCLAGERVRYNGEHKRNDDLLSALTPFVDWVRVCPEVEIGLGTPRPPIQLEQAGAEVRLVMPSTKSDLTDQMKGYASGRLNRPDFQEVRGYILKSRSPSCGLRDVPIAGSGKRGRGIFAAELTQFDPHLPVADEAELGVQEARDSFVERVCAYDRLRNFFSRPKSRGQVVMLTSQLRSQLESHSAEGFAMLSKIAVNSPMDEIERAFSRELMRILEIPATRGSHAQVMRRVAKMLGADHALVLIEMYERDAATFGEPLLLLAAIHEESDNPHLVHSTYVEPYQMEVELRRSV